MFSSHLKSDSILQDHKPLRWPQIALSQTPIGISDGELHSNGAKRAFFGVSNHIQGGHALAQPRHGGGLLQQEILAAVKGDDAMAIIAGQDVHGG